ncbi:MAG TPA: DNA ligase D [Anaerolineales bacterium]|nr:DNA ligase D [Anaerolineales bacterium]
MTLQDYDRKRDFERTPEPPPGPGREPGERRPRFLVHKHEATRLHYDLRLELDGVLKSWAVPRGPSLDPDEKRLAVLVEDHPFDYGEFEGIIPEGNYGAGTVMIWDEGTFGAPKAETFGQVQDSLRDGLAKGTIKVILEGAKLKGQFALVRLKKGGENDWLLIKDKDDHATPRDILELDRSARSGRSMDEIRRQELARPRADAIAIDLLSVDLSDASAAAFPSDVSPMLAELVTAPFTRPGWLFEIKWDGYRAVAEIHADEVRLYSRNQVSFLEDFPPVVEDLKRISAEMVLDGEIVAVDSDGRARMRLLREYLRSRQGRLVYYVFDLLYLDGRDLTGLPLSRRRAILKQVLPDLPHIRMSDGIEEQGEALFASVVEAGVEGIIAKDLSSPYTQGARGTTWRKIKARARQDFVIGGFTEARGEAMPFGAILVGVYDGKDLVFTGRVGTGFDEKERARIKAALTPLVQPKCPFREAPQTDTPATWVSPQIVCSVNFTEWTEDGYLREPVYESIRSDHNPRLVARREAAPEVPVASKRRFYRSESASVRVEIGGQTLNLTNLEKVYWPEDGYTKGDMIAYYRDVATLMLPYLEDRPESLHRFPNGIAAKSFYQKDIEQPPPWLKTVRIESESKGESINFLVCQDEASLVYMANLGSIEIHPWNSRLESLEQPDWLVIDLDPADQTFEQIVAVAQTTHEILETAGAESFVKTSGATGLHIYVPLGARYTYEQGRQFASLVAHLVHARHPKLTSLERKPSSRKGKMYLDAYQNRRGQTLAAPYSIRPLNGAPVSTPLRWNELQPGLRPGAFTIKTVRERLDRVGDLWGGVLGLGIDMEACLAALQPLWADTMGAGRG